MITFSRILCQSLLRGFASLGDRNAYLEQDLLARGHDGCDWNGALYVGYDVGADRLEDAMRCMLFGGGPRIAGHQVIAAGRAEALNSGRVSALE
jgi:hypothetical protein